tara:strand:- start:5849 stop:7027 length:1179 start_codon:yes stop_codon:yes gene_type:complete
MASKSFCPLPWTHLATHPHGAITLCCEAEQLLGASHAKDNPDKFKDLHTEEYDFNNIHNNDNFNDVRLQMLAGTRPSVCTRCWDKEDAGQDSKRTIDSRKLNFNIDDANEITNEDGSLKEVSYEFVELRLGNHCNLACRTCNPISSSRWKKDWQKAKFDERLILPQNLMDWPLDSKFWDSLLQHVKNLRVLYINGGEPLLVDKHKDFLYKLVELDIAKNVEIVYSTNVTIINKEYEEAWKGFRKVQMMLSLDDVGDRNSYVRHLSKWEKVLKTFEWLSSLEQVDTNMMCTVSTLNVYYLKEYFEYYKNKTNYISLNFVNDPDYYDIRNLPLEVKQEVLKKFPNEQLRAWMMQEGKNSLDRFMKHTQTLDIIRNQSFEKTFPEWNDMLRKHNV